ncbi:Mediator complex subunit 15 [Hirschfeldia incana]|nr:Mediator complex subunit 15 [Hirschfeldia incana]
MGHSIKRPNSDFNFSLSRCSSALWFSFAVTLLSRPTLTSKLRKSQSSIQDRTHLMGPSCPSGEPAIDTLDWRTQLQSDARESIVNMITEALKKQHLPFSGPEGVYEHRKIASRFEDKVFNTAANLNDYLRKISLEVLTIENTVKRAADPLISIPDANNTTPFSSAGKGNVDVGSLMDNNSLRPSSLPSRESALDTGDWRTQLPPAARRMIIINITDTLEKQHPGTERTNELRRFAARLEDIIFNSAAHQIDYLRQISAKISLLAANNCLPLDLGHLDINRGDWRTLHPPGSRQKNVNKLLETLKKQVPYSGEEGIEELTRIAVSFEELIFNTAKNQVDYFSKISLKMQSMEDGS